MEIIWNENPTSVILGSLRVLRLKPNN